jgi:hypothetical protein
MVGYLDGCVRVRNIERPEMAILTTHFKLPESKNRFDSKGKPLRHKGVKNINFVTGAMGMLIAQGMDNTLQLMLFEKD